MDETTVYQSIAGYGASLSKSCLLSFQKTVMLTDLSADASASVLNGLKVQLIEHHASSPYPLILHTDCE